MIKAKMIKRQHESLLVDIGVPIFSILLAFIVSGLFLYFSGYDPGETFSRMLKGAFGSSYAVSETIVKAIPLMLAGLAVSLAFRMKLWNIGAEGQLYMGAFAASWVALSFGDLSSWVLLPLMFLAGFIGGAVWGFIPGALRGYWQVNETITTLMLNYIAISWVSYLVFGPWKDPASKGFPLTPRFTLSGYLPSFGDSRVHMGLLVAVVIAVLFYLVLRYSRWGYEIKVIGESQNAARYAGMNVARNMVLVMLISGGIAGITGMRDNPSAATGYFTGIWLYSSYRGMAGQIASFQYYRGGVPVWCFAGRRFWNTDFRDSLFNCTHVGGEYSLFPFSRGIFAPV